MSGKGATGGAPHLWLALSPHGFGHAAMTAPVIAQLRRRLPDLRLTIQSSVSPDFLASRYDEFELVDEIVDFGLRMLSSTRVDLAASAADYAGLHRDFARHVERDRARLAQARPDLVLSNVAYVPLAAAAAARIPALAMSSLNWADMYAHYLGDQPEAPAILAQMRAAYHGALAFLCCTPSQAMTLDNLRPIGPLALVGHPDRAGLRRRLGLGADIRLGLIAFGGIRHDLALERWPRLPGWCWLTNDRPAPGRDDQIACAGLGLAFPDLIASIDLVVTKPGYGTFTEAAMTGTPVLYTARPDWPESPHLDRWLANHTRSMMVAPEDLPGADLGSLLRTLFSKPPQRLARPTGIGEAVDILEVLLRGGRLEPYAVGGGGFHHAAVSTLAVNKG